MWSYIINTLLLPCRKDVADVGMDFDNVPYPWDDAVLIIRGAMMEEPTGGGEHELE